MNPYNYKGRTIEGMPAAKLIGNLSRLEKAIKRVEHYLSYNFDPETTAECVRYVAKSSGYSADVLSENMRLNLKVNQ